MVSSTAKSSAPVSRAKGVRQEPDTEHRERLNVPRKGFRKVSPQQARQQTIATQDSRHVTG